MYVVVIKPAYAYTSLLVIYQSIELEIQVLNQFFEKGSF